MWWSGLTAADTKRGLEIAKPRLEVHEIESQIYWFDEVVAVTIDLLPSAYLLPNYDEYTSYKDRSAIFDSKHAAKMDAEQNTVFPHYIVLNGRIAGTWRRIFEKRTLVITAHPFEPMSAGEEQAFAMAAERYGEFLGMPVVCT
jgi:Winged helix DNA-binding domain